MGLLLLVLSSAAAVFGLHLLTEVARLVSYRERGPVSYLVTSKHTFPQAAVFINIAVAVKCIGVAISYLVVVGDLMPYAMNHFVEQDHAELSFLVERQAWIGFTMAVLVPVSMLKNMDNLKVTSWLALASLVYIVGISSYYCFTLPTSSSINPVPITITYFPSDTKVFSAIPIFVFAFTCHQNLFTIYNEGKKKEVPKVIYVSVSTGLITYLLIACFGYFTFGQDVSSNLLSDFPIEQVPVVIARICMSVSVALSFPLQLHPCRTAIIAIFQHFSKHNIFKSHFFFVLVTFLICTFCFLVAFFVDDLGFVFSLVGATGSVALCYIMPASFYIKLKQNSQRTFKKIAAIGLLVFGIVIMLNSLIFIFLNQFVFHTANVH
eukprot:TRINITY_DN797_c0_g1_i2.p1 TRINITY_DN797_c0_g1~~TRINITY_DN797_c0_g1_i2.p1  ORF type:complete len:378 (+),score=30.33 TRINITY_DN797_c0_g1_i2:241-1374(+)